MSKRYEPHFGGDPRLLAIPAGEKAIWSDGTVPTAGVAGYRKSCIHQRKATAGVFVNDGTETSATFNRVVTSTDDTALTATIAEVNRETDASARIVVTTATALTLSVTQHAGRIVLVQTNSTVANTFTLPAATGTGERFTIINDLLQTQGTVVFTVTGADVMKGICKAFHSTTTTGGGGFFTTNATAVTLNLTTTGGDGGDKLVAVDAAAGRWLVEVEILGSGTLATPFS